GLASWGATIVRGAEFVARITGLEGRIAEADLVVTGEGGFDHQSLLGKTPGLVLELAARHGVPAGVGAGRVAPGSGQDAVSLVELAGSPEAAMAEPRAWLQEAGAMLARRTERRRRR
ncbi:glycerate kinase, partial [Mesorhizobium japonicum]|uniref:glycerate kinase n=1 Tax=Mesorhizobium japonicum TaxID=2066070 RepID=UPI003B5CF20B